MPEIVGDESVGVKYAINGLIALTPDGMPLLGETPEVKGLWSAAAVWVKEGPAVGKSIAEWMVHGEPEIDCNQSRHQPLPRPPEDAPAHQGPRVRGVPQDVRHRPPGRAVPVRPPAAPVADARVARRAHEAEFFEVAGWERPQWFSSNAPLVEKLRRPDPAQRVGRPLVVADHQRRAPRHARVGRHLRPLGVRHLRHRRAGRPGRGPGASRCARWTSRSAASSTRPSCRAGRLQERPHDHAPRGPASSASSPAAPTA